MVIHLSQPPAAKVQGVPAHVGDCPDLPLVTWGVVHGERRDLVGAAMKGHHEDNAPTGPVIDAQGVDV